MGALVSNSKPPVDQPGPSLFDSKFLKFYDKAPKSPKPKDVMEALKKVCSEQHVDMYKQVLTQSTKEDNNKAVFEVLPRPAKKTVAATAVRAWASEAPDTSVWVDEDDPKQQPLFKILNSALIEEDDALQHWVWFIRSMNDFLTDETHAPTQDLTTYRGSKMTEAQASILKPGTVVRPRMFVASSLEWNIAKGFVGDAKYILHFEIGKGCRNATAIYHIAVCENEKEVLMPPYSPIYIKSVDEVQDGTETYKVIRALVLDGFMFGRVEQGHMKASEIGLPDELSGKNVCSCIV